MAQPLTPPITTPAPYTLNFLTDHAIQNISASRYQDKQYIFRGKRISRVGGVRSQFTFMGRSLQLPTLTDYFHVYNIGRLPTKFLGLLARYPEWTIEKWYSLEDAINNNDLIVNLYITEGVEIPKFTSRYMFTNEGDMILVVKEEPILNITYDDTVYLRTYNNAYFQSPRSSHLTIKTFSTGGYMLTTQNILDLQVVYNNYELLPGHVFAFVNGYKVKAINLITVTVGDVVELLYDSSVKETIVLNINDLYTFSSTVDSKLKYLLHYPDVTPDGTDGDTIYYHDDIDVHILSSDTEVLSKGLYYNKNALDSFRMVTHRDYSIPVDYAAYVANALSNRVFDGSLVMDDMFLEIKVRHNGFDRKLEYEANRLFELYKLTDTDVLEALIQTPGSLAEWRAEFLEASPYSNLISAFSSDINTQLVLDTYGYNGLSKITADTPVKPIASLGIKTAELPYLLTSNSTVYEYDVDGKLLRVNDHVLGNVYMTTDLNTELLEVIYGKGSQQPHVVFGTDNITLDVSNNYRVYRAFIVGGVVDENWEDVTGSNLYSVVNDVLIWGSIEFNQFLMVRYDDEFLSYNLDTPINNGALSFTLNEYVDRGNGLISTVMSVPMGQLDIWLNGKSLIEHIDYEVDFPVVYINCKDHLVQPAASSQQNIEVRFTGFCNSDLSRDNTGDYGFVEHGVLSNNDKFDIRDDKVLRITLGGKTIAREDVIFSEQHSGVSIVNAINGLPYSVRDIVVPIKAGFGVDTYVARDISRELDQRVADYMTLKLPQPVRNGLSSISRRYPLVSPFFATVISHVELGIINLSDPTNYNTDTKIISLLSSYEYLLASDPISRGANLNTYYVAIHPIVDNMPRTISFINYKFLEDVVRLYANGTIDLTNFFTITA